MNHREPTDQYQSIQVVGCGAYATVYQAKHGYLCKDGAIKVSCRDIKPENVFCGEHRYTYLIDFSSTSVVRKTGRRTGHQTSLTWR